MSSLSLAVMRPIGRALVIGSGPCRTGPLEVLQRQGYSCAEADDPYTAMAELCRRPGGFKAVVLSLASLYREELTLILTIKRRWPQLDVWLAQTSGRHAALADAMQYGADGLLAEDGLHRNPGAIVRADTDATAPEPATAIPPSPSAPAADIVESPGEPILTAEELRALLSDQPIATPEES